MATENVTNVDEESINLPSLRQTEDHLDLNGKPAQSAVEKVCASVEDVRGTLAAVAARYPDLAHFARVTDSMLVLMDSLRDEAKHHASLAEFTANKAGDAETARRLRVLVAMLGQRDQKRSLYIH